MVFSYDQPWSIVFRLWSDAFKDKVVNPFMLKYEKKWKESKSPSTFFIYTVDRIVPKASTLRVLLTNYLTL